MSVKTIFITSFNPFISRNILETDTLKSLSAEKNLRIVIFVPEYKKDYFSEKFGRGNILIEGIKDFAVSKQDIFFRYITSSLINSRTLLFHQREKLARDRNYFHYLLSRFFAVFMSQSKFFKRVVRLLDFLTIKKEYFSDYLEKYCPKLLFSTDIFHNLDTHFLAEAKNRHVPTVSMIRSWDNVTNKGIFRVKPDNLIVHNEIIKSQAIKHEDMKEQNIFVSGLPQFDHYFKGFQPSLREVFFKKIGLDHSKKTILFAPHGKRFHNTDWHILEIIKNKLDKNLQFIVRFPPNDTVEFNSFVPDHRFFIKKTGFPFPAREFKDNEVTFKDTLSLAEELYHSDLVINYGSTISIDAAVFNKPVILIAFDGWEKLPYEKSVRRFLEYNHVNLLIQTGFFLVAKNEEELLNLVGRYLKKPIVNEAARNKLMNEQVWKVDGLSGERISGYIKSLIFD